MDNVFNIYIYDPYGVRLIHYVNDLGMEKDIAKKMIMEVDKAGDAYHMNYVGYKTIKPIT